MGKLYEGLSSDLRQWLAEQKVFFVATAPLAGEGHVNCSPKGGDTFRILSDHEVAYLDLTGSGIETTAHLQENGRIVLMFCAFAGAPNIVRLHGRGKVVYPADPEFSRLQQNFPSHNGARGIVVVTLTRISNSCGHGVPVMEFVSSRDLIENWSLKKGPDGLAEYRAAKNAASIDGIPGYQG
jgi:pyridoxamine 5'-phosphate oxidase-like protein